MTLASRLFDPLVRTAEMDPGAAGDALLPEERAAVAQAVEKRRREFAAGRTCARRALAAMGWQEPAPILQGRDRVPIWPRGVVGCISHADSLCSVAVARVADGFRSLGLDVEQAVPIKPELLRIVCRPEERAYLESRAESERYLLGKIMFSAKECAYKCQYVLSHTFLNFHAMHILLDMEGGTFLAVFQQDAAPFAAGDELRGRLLVEQGYILTAMALTTQAGEHAPRAP